MSIHPLKIIVREVENAQTTRYRFEKDAFIFYISYSETSGERCGKDVITTLELNLGKSLVYYVCMILSLILFFFFFKSQHKERESLYFPTLFISNFRGRLAKGLFLDR